MPELTDSEAETDDLAIDRQNENETTRSSVTSVSASVLGRNGREFKSIRALYSCTQRYWVVIRTKFLNGGWGGGWEKIQPLSHLFLKIETFTSLFISRYNWYLKISSPNVFFGLPPTAPFLQQLSNADVVVHYGNGINSQADVYRVSCHASSVTAAVPSLVTKCLPRCKLSDSPHFRNFRKEKYTNLKRETAKTTNLSTVATPFNYDCFEDRQT